MFKLAIMVNFFLFTVLIVMQWWLARRRKSDAVQLKFYKSSYAFTGMSLKMLAWAIEAEQKCGVSAKDILQKYSIAARDAHYATSVSDYPLASYLWFNLARSLESMSDTINFVELIVNKNVSTRELLSIADSVTQDRLCMDENNVGE